MFSYRVFQGHEELVNQLVKGFEAHKLRENFRYELTKDHIDLMVKVEANLSTKKLSTVQAKEFGVENMCNDVFIELLKVMHEQVIIYLILVEIHNFEI